MATDSDTLGAHVPRDLAEEVENIAEERGESKSKVVQDLVERGIEDRHWTRHLAPIFKEAMNVSLSFALLVPLLMLFFTDHALHDAVLLGMVFTVVGTVAMLLAMHFAEDQDELFGS